MVSMLVVIDSFLTTLFGGEEGNTLKEAVPVYRWVWLQPSVEVCSQPMQIIMYIVCNK